jgi:hypothetical protein
MQVLNLGQVRDNQRIWSTKPLCPQAVRGCAQEEQTVIRGKKGHASDSVYKDVHGIKNTLCGLLTSKINVFKGTNCHEWKPTGDLLASCKSATYQALNY